MTKDSRATRMIRGRLADARKESTRGGNREQIRKIEDALHKSEDLDRQEEQGDDPAHGDGWSW
jgi:hypothetical protein